MARYAKHTFRSGRYTNGIVRRRGMGRYIFLVILIVILVVGGVFLFKFLIATATMTKIHLRNMRKDILAVLKIQTL